MVQRKVTFPKVSLQSVGTKNISKANPSPFNSCQNSSQLDPVYYHPVLK